MTQPNLLIVLSDQLRRQALGCYGEPDLKTPHVDALAKHGVRFDAACSTYPICVPYRFTLMTGHHAHSRMVPGIDWRMSPAERTLADEFNDADYDTIYIGKWHLNGGAGTSAMNKPVPRVHQGRWRTWRGFEFRNDFFDTHIFHDDDPTPRKLRGYQTDGLTDVCIDLLKQRNAVAKPFCCVLSVEAPHPPMEAPEAYEAQWRGRELTLPPNFMIRLRQGPYPAGPTPDWSREQFLNYRRIYNAMVQNLDDNVGRLMETLRETGLDQNTIVVFTSDHGESAGSHHCLQKQGPLEESVGVPLLVAGPGIPAGVVRPEPTCTEDLFPTFLGLCSLPPRNDLSGCDLTQLIREPRATLQREGVLLEFVSELRPNMHFYRRPYRGLRTRRWKYVVLTDPEDHNKHPMHPWLLFDLENDPYELTNLIGDPAHRNTTQHLHALLRRMMLETGDHAWLAGFDEIPPLNPVVVSQRS